MATEFNGKIELDIRDSEPDWGPFAAPTAPESAPNILYLVWDDTGIATWDCFGGLVEMPAMTRIADRGVRLSQFHTTALCSPTRASLLTGRNATTVGMATIEEFTDGFPNCNGRIPADTAWYPVGALPRTAFDHESIIKSARERLRAKLSYTNLGFALAPATFTINELREIYAAALGHPVSATNLQRILVRRGVIERTPATVRPAAVGGRPATLYRFASRTLEVTNPFAAFRPPSCGS